MPIIMGCRIHKMLCNKLSIVPDHPRESTAEKNIVKFESEILTTMSLTEQVIL